MARLARVVIPGLPHHVTQRGNGRARTFFSNANYALYRDLLAESCRAADVEVWAWCLMPNHVHLILAPSDADGLRRALAPVHRRYAGIIHAAITVRITVKCTNLVTVHLIDLPSQHRHPTAWPASPAS